MAAVVQDLLSEQFIAQLLENDLNLLESYKQAEKLQLDQALAVSARAQGRIPKYSNADSLSTYIETDGDIAFEMYVSDALVGNDADYAQAIQNETFAMDTINHQLAQRLAANERKINIDAEFARRLQAIDDEGQDIDEVKDAESIMGDHRSNLDPNVSMGDPTDCLTIDEKPLLGGSKGKGRQLSSPIASPKQDDQHQRIRFAADGLSVVKNEVEDGTPFLSNNAVPYPTCGICMEAFIVTNSPITASLSANSSNRLSFGLRLPCPKEHPYCISCLTSYIQNKLDPDGNGIGKSGAIVFPIRCPECPLSAWPTGIEDEVARKVLGENGMVEWHHQKILDSLPRFFCPYPKCSSLLEVDQDSEDPQATCPSCQEMICIPCRTRWHSGLNCEEYQALPLDERSPEDRLVLDLAKAEQWRRCPNCAVIVEYVFGCNHMTCRCGFHFCFKCGSPSTEQGKCKSNPPCELWDEERLLEAQERERNRPAAVVQPANQVYMPQALGAFLLPPRFADQHVQPHRAPVAYRDELEWMNDPNVLCGKHWFTTNMIGTLTCGYCA